MLSGNISLTLDHYSRSASRRKRQKREKIYFFSERGTFFSEDFFDFKLKIGNSTLEAFGLLIYN